MLHNITERHTVTENHYELLFYVDRNGGLAFPCNADGMVIWRDMSDAAIANYRYALEHPEEYPYCFNKIHKYVRRYVEPANGICDCGARVYLTNEYMGACQCPRCGQWYNLFGQELLPPEEWEDDDYVDDYGWEDVG